MTPKEIQAAVDEHRFTCDEERGRPCKCWLAPLTDGRLERLLEAAQEVGPEHDERPYCAIDHECPGHGLQNALRAILGSKGDAA